MGKYAVFRLIASFVEGGERIVYLAFNKKYDVLLDSW